MIEIFKGASAQHRVQCLSWVNRVDQIRGESIAMAVIL